MNWPNLDWKTPGALLAVSASIVAVAVGSVEARPQAGGQVPVVSSDPAVQRSIEVSLTRLRLDPAARVGSLDFSDRPLKEIIEAVANAGGIRVGYASGLSGLDSAATIAVAPGTVEDALGAVLKGRGLAFEAAAPKMVFIFPDTPENRERYTVSNRVFPVAHGDPATLASELNRALRSPSEVFQPMILTVRDSRTIIVHAAPDMMARAAAWLAEHDK